MATANVTREKILGFRELEPGWHYGEGVSFEQPILKKAICLSQDAETNGFYNNAFPGANGEIMLCVYHRKHYLEFTIEPSGSITFYWEENDEETCHQEGLSLQEAQTKIKLLSYTGDIPEK